MVVYSNSENQTSEQYHTALGDAEYESRLHAISVIDLILKIIR